MPAYLLLAVVSLALASGTVSLAKSFDQWRPTLYFFPLQPLAIAIWLALSVTIGVVIVYAALLRHGTNMSVGAAFFAGWVPGTIFMGAGFLFVLTRLPWISVRPLITIEYFIATVITAAIATWLGIAFGRRLVVFAARGERREA